MTDKWKNETIDCDFGPYCLFQESQSSCPVHQVAQVVLNGCVFRPRLIRAVVNKVTTGNGGRGNVQHTHDVYHVVIPRSGTAMLRHNGEIVTVALGTVRVISPGEPHCFMIDAHHCCYTALTFEFVDVAGNRPLALPFPELLTQLSGAPLRGMTETIAVPEHAESAVHLQAMDMARTAEDDPARCANSLLQLLLDCASWHNDAAGVSGPETKLERVYDRIRKTFRKPLSIDDLAAEASMSRRTLTRRFKDRFGTTMKRLQLRLRMDAATMMLKTTNMQVQEIAEEIGYGDLYQFTSAFTKHVGVSPSTYRKSAV